MSNWIVLGIGMTAGILFSFAFPEPALAVNEALSPIVQTGFNFIAEIIGDILRNSIGKVLA